MVHFGSAVVAAHQSVISFTNVFYCLPLSIAMASTIAVAYELGAGRKQEAIQYSYISRILAIVLAIMICTFTFTNMDAIADLFTMMMKYTSLSTASLDTVYSSLLSMPLEPLYKVY